MLLKSITTKPTEEWTAKLPLWRDGTHNFAPSPGLTVLFGPNGCGKTTLLTAIAKSCYIDKNRTNRQTYFTPISVRSNELRDGFLSQGDAARLKREQAHKDYRTIAPGLTVQTDWAGQHVAWIGPDTFSRNLVHTDQIFDRVGGFETWLGLRTASEGQNALGILSSALNMKSRLAERIPESEIKYVNDTWQDAIEVYNSCIPDQVNEDSAVPVLLMDEPDRSLSIPTQAAFYEKLKEQISQRKIQVIVASHSIFALSQADMVVDFVPGYADTVLSVVRKAVGKN